MGFCLISFELAKIQRYDFAVCSVTIYYCRLQKMVQNSDVFASNVQIGDNWYLAIIGPRPVQKEGHSTYLTRRKIINCIVKHWYPDILLL
jgi:hypothetical protein